MEVVFGRSHGDVFPNASQPDRVAQLVRTVSAVVPCQLFVSRRIAHGCPGMLLVRRDAASIETSAFGGPPLHPMGDVPCGASFVSSRFLLAAKAFSF